MGPEEAAALAQRFAIPGVVDVVTGDGGLTKIVVTGAHAAGEMYLHGAHVTSWIPRDEAEVLYLSPNSAWEDGRAIRGGVPVCFPWFGDSQCDPSAPAHGFVRTRNWALESVERAEQGTAVTIAIESDDASRKWWPFEFRLVSRVTFGSQLKLELITTNTGSSPFTFEEALHAYFAVGNAESGFVRGLEAKRYIDKTDGRIQKMQAGDIHISSETDRVYLGTEQAVQLFDSAGKRCVSLVKGNSKTTVVWNPWIQKAIELKDLGADQWKRFVCIETSNVAPFAVGLEPGQRHAMTAAISVARYGTQP